jgi:hypothetical protein
MKTEKREANSYPRVCPICAEWKYKSLVKTCPICGGPGGIGEVNDLATNFMRLWETGTFEEVWDAIIPWDKPYPCPNSGEPDWKPTPCPGPPIPTPGIVRCYECHWCDDPTCHESMPHGNHPDWLAFVAGADDPNDPWAKAIPEDETLGQFEMRIAALPDEERFAARRARLYRNCVFE